MNLSDKVKFLSNNRELYQYLLFWAAALKKRNLGDLSEAVVSASRQASGSSTEFLGESRIVFRRVLKEDRKVLTAQERDDLSDILRQLDEALDKR
jgi:hypothetical protein